MKYIRKFNNSNLIENYIKSNFISPHLFLNSQFRNVNYFPKYKRLNYISSTVTGGQYIDLGCKLLENTDNIRIDIKFNIKGRGKNSTNSQGTLIAAQPETSPYPGFTLRYQNNSSSTNLQLITKWEYSGCYFSNNKGLSRNLSYDSTYRLDNYIYEFTEILDNIPDSQINNFNCHLFCALNSSNQPFRFVEADLYYLRFYKGEQLIRNLIPVQRQSDGICGLWDLEHQLFYTSQGDEQFVAGTKYIERQPNEELYDSEIEYLESGGTQYIDTLIHPITGYGFELYGGFTHFENDEFFGGGTSYNNGLGICTHRSSYGIVVGTTEVCTITVKNNVMHLFRVNSDGTVYIDNEYKGQSDTEMPNGSYTMHIFKHYSNQKPQEERIYYCKIFDNNENLVFDGIPVRVGNIGYMYDRVTDRLFENKGSGTFVLGPDKI